MGVRMIFPNSISFTVELRCSTVKRYRVTLDLQERFIFMSSSIVPDISRCIESFADQLSEITSNQLALLKWDGTSDLTTEYQIIRVLPGYQLDRISSFPRRSQSIVRFPVAIGEGSLIHLEELPSKTTIQL
jgi:hypothetical protein